MLAGRQSYRDAGSAIAYALTLPAPPINGLALVMEGRRDLGDCLALLLGVITEASGTPQFTARAAKPRAELVAYALGKCARAATEFQSARAIFAPLAGTERVLLGIDTALYNLAHVDRALAYASPLKLTQIIGPHGDYVQAQWHLWRSYWYAGDGQSTWRDISTALGVVVPEYPKRIVDGQNTVLDRLLVLSRIYFTDEQRGKGDFFNAVDTHGTLTAQVGLPGVWKMANIASHKLAAMAGAKGLYVEAERLGQNMADLWLHSDEGAWRHIIFLDCTLLHNPVGCPGSK